MMGRTYSRGYMTDHATERCDEREISPFLVKLCHTFGKKLSRSTRLLKLDLIPAGLYASLKHSLRNRIEHQLPIVGVFIEKDDGSYAVITAYRAREGRRIRKEPGRDTYMSRLARKAPVSGPSPLGGEG